MVSLSIIRSTERSNPGAGLWSSDAVTVCGLTLILNDLFQNLTK
ncbi:hypothetical protein NIES2104_27870 [Leptolyngbya sp. NIES-2104]|nr:hypothetical protein NIES2104_27870 [Leptolyngbya sp. NIES-2104]